MEAGVIMAFLSIVGAIISSYSSNRARNDEYLMQQQLQEDAQQFTHEQTEWNWEHTRPQQVFEDYLSLGFNPNLAAASIMGNGSESVSAASSPTAPPVNSAIDALQRTIGQGGQNLYDIALKNAQIRNINSDTNLKDVDAGLKPREFDLKKLSTEKQFEVWDKSIEESDSRIHLNEEVKNLYKEQVTYYGQKTEAEIDALEQSVVESIKRCKVMDEEIKNKQKERQVMDSEIAVNASQVALNEQNTVKSYNESVGQDIANDRSMIAKNFESSINAPLSADAQQYVNKLMLDGEYDKVEQFYLNLFNIAKNQKPTQTSKGVPFGIWKQDTYNIDGRSRSAKQTHNGVVWNPQWN